MALPWSEVRDALASNPQAEAALRRWAIWLKVESAESMTKQQLLIELNIRGFVFDDLIRPAYS